MDGRGVEWPPGRGDVYRTPGRVPWFHRFHAWFDEENALCAVLNATSDGDLLPAQSP